MSAIFITLIVSMGGAITDATVARASAEPSLACRWEKGTTFTNVLKSITTQARITIIAEGKPLQSTLGSSLVDTFPMGRGPVNAVVQEAATRFDYHAEHRGSVFYLTKRYTKPEDFPSITLEECRLYLSDVVRVGQGLNPKIPPPAVSAPGSRLTTVYPLIDPIVDSFSPEQKTALEVGLPVSSLSDMQRVLIQKFEMHFYLQNSLDELAKGLKRLEGSRGTEAQLAFGTYPGASRSFLVYRYREPSGFIAGGSLSSVNIPTASEVTTFSVPQASIDTAERIGDLVNRLNRYAPTGSESSVVDPSLADKIVTVAGEANSAPEETLTGVARVYGLRVYAETDAQTGKKQRRLTRPRTTQIAQPSEIAPTVLKLMPAPIRAIIHDDNPPATEAEADPRFAYGKELAWNLRRASRFRNAATQRLTHLLASLPAFKTDKPDRYIALSETSAETKNLLAIALILEQWQPLWNLTQQKTPHYISNPNDVYLRGGDVLDKATGEKKGFTLSLNYKTPEGGWQDEGGVYRNYPKAPPK